LKAGGESGDRRGNRCDLFRELKKEDVDEY